MANPRTPSLLDSIRRTIEERNLFSVRSRGNYISALLSADKGTVRSNGSTYNKTPVSSSVESRLKRLRAKVIHEIVQSEEIYVKHLKIIQSEFMEDDEIRLGFSRRDFHAIFGNISMLYEVNQKLLDELKGALNIKVQLMSTKNVAEAFINYGPYLKLYSTYALGYQQANNLLMATMNQNLILRDLIKTKEEKLNNTLQSYLITPIQRIPRYKLLLEQLAGFMGYTTGGCRKNHVAVDMDLQAILDSIQKLDQVAHHMNESIKQHENSMKLIELSKWLKNFELVEPGRTFIKDGVVLKPMSLTTFMLPTQIQHKNSNYLILVSDQLILSKIKGELGTKWCLQPTMIMPLKKCIATKSYITNNGEFGCEVKCDNETIRFSLTDQEELEEWVNAVNEAAQNLKRRSATLKRPSSHASPMRKEQIKKVLKSHNSNSKNASPRGLKRTRENDEDSPAPTPGKLRRFLNISERLDDLSNYFSPKSLSTFKHATLERDVPSKPKKKVKRKTSRLSFLSDNVISHRLHTLEEENNTPAEKPSEKSCPIL